MEVQVIFLKNELKLTFFEINSSLMSSLRNKVKLKLFLGKRHSNLIFF